ncbi:MAG: FkbM family methyltransferase [Bacteroidota bacterium]|nr:FkbM family methyltransferase [Bacteroidota bacterium]
MGKYSIKKVLNRLLCKTPGLYASLIEIFHVDILRQKSVYLKYVKSGDYVIDVGANYGIITLLLSDITGRKGKVFSYEALPPVFETLQKNLRSLRFYDNINVFNLAVTDKNELITISVPGEDFGQASMKAHQSGSWALSDKISSYQCQSVQLDEHLKDIAKIDFIKLDIEGAELLALHGAVRIIKKFKPVLYVEIYKEWTKEFGYHPIDIYQFLYKLGYRKFIVEMATTSFEVKNAETDLDLNCSADMICIF